jgi:molybdate transport system substrate-binding protein
MRAIGASAAAAFAVIISAGAVTAAEIRVLSVGSVQIATKAIAPEFETETGHKIVFTIVSPDLIADRLAGGSYDMLIASVPVIAALDKSGAIRAGTRTPLSRAGIGVMVRDGAPVPDVSTPDAFKTALLAAKSIAYGDPALPNQSGEVTVRILAKAGILDTIKPKLRAAGLGPGLAMVAKGEVELALFNQVELPKGVRLAGAVPLPLQDYTSYEAAVMAKGTAPEASQAFINRLTSAASRKSWEAARLEAYPYK